MKIFRKIVDGRFSCPRHMGTEAKNIVLTMLQKSMPKRLGNLKRGMDDVKAHNWFHDVPWDKLRTKRYQAPWTPGISDPMDCSNFDAYEEEDRIPKYKGSQEVFANF